MPKMSKQKLKKKKKNGLKSARLSSRKNTSVDRVVETLNKSKETNQNSTKDTVVSEQNAINNLIDTTEGRTNETD